MWRTVRGVRTYRKGCRTVTPAERAELEGIVEQWAKERTAAIFSPLEQPSTQRCISDMRRFLVRHSGGEAAESERDTECADCGDPVCVSCGVFSEVGQALCEDCYRYGARKTPFVRRREA